MMLDKPLCVLVVEDDFLLATAVAAAAKKQGLFVAGPVPTAAKAFLELEEKLPDGAILDVRLGASDSFEVARFLATRGVPFVFFSAVSSEDLPEDLRAQRLLSKLKGPDAAVLTVLKLIGQG